jgi:Rho GDP-dissociation inhibitor
MSSNRKVTFQEPDREQLRQRAAVPSTENTAIGMPGGSLAQSMGAVDREIAEVTAPCRPVRSRSPYPHVSPLEDDSEYMNGFFQTLRNPTSTFKNLGCHRAQTDGDDTSDEGDESLQRYKQSLGLGGGNDLSDPNDPRVCIIQSLTMESPGRSPVVIDLSAPGSTENLKKNPFKIKEGATFTMSAQFKVQHEILSGLHYVQVIKRKGIRIPGGKSDEMIVSSPVLSLRNELKEILTLQPQGSYAPNTDKQPIYTKKCMFTSPSQQQAKLTNCLLSPRGDRPLWLGRP